MPLQSALRRPRTVWLALWLTLFSALAPTLSHALALARSDASAGFEICTSTGMLWVAAGHEESAPHVTTPSSKEAGNPASGRESALSVVHCPFCLLSSMWAAPPPYVFAYLFASPGSSAKPVGRQISPCLARFTLAAAPRGPPAFS